MGIWTSLSLMVGEKAASLGDWAVGHPRLSIEGFAEDVERMVLPGDHKTRAYFPKTFDAARTLPVDLKSFETRLVRVRNKGWKDHAMTCEVVAFLTGPSGVMPIATYWADAGEREYVNIPPRESRRFVPFLVDPTSGTLLFCTALYPDVLDESTWQHEIPARTPFYIDILVRSDSARSSRRVFYLSARGANAADLDVQGQKELHPDDRVF